MFGLIQIIKDRDRSLFMPRGGGGWRKLRGGSEIFLVWRGGASRKNFLFEGGGALKIRIYKNVASFWGATTFIYRITDLLL